MALLHVAEDANVLRNVGDVQRQLKLAGGEGGQQLLNAGAVLPNERAIGAALLARPERLLDQTRALPREQTEAVAAEVADVLLYWSSWHTAPAARPSSSARQLLRTRSSSSRSSRGRYA